MPINGHILSGQRTPHRNHALFLNIGDHVTLSRDLTTTEPNRRFYQKGSVGWIRKFYGNGVVLEMADRSKIPVSFDFLDIPKPSTAIVTTPMPRPYESLL